MSEKVIKLVEATYPVRADFIEQLERVLQDARDGKVTSLAWCAVGPNFVVWNNAYCRGRGDRLVILGQLAMMGYELTKQELESE